MADEAAKAQQTLWQAMTREEQKAIRERLKSGAKPSAAEPTAPAQGTFNLVGYVRCDLGKSDREPFRLWETELEDSTIANMLVSLCDSGYLLKCGLGREGYQATLSAVDTKSGVDGYVLAAFAGGARESLALLLYKHHILLEGDWTPYLSGSGKSGLR